MKIDFIEKLKQSIENEEFIKCTLGKIKSKEEPNLQNIYIKPINIKDEYVLSFLYRHKTKDVTKNFSITEAIDKISSLIGNEVLSAHSFSTEENLELLFNKKRKATLRNLPPTLKKESSEHNRTKRRLISAENNIYLKRLGVVSSKNEVYHNKQDKFKQINKYVEIVEAHLKDLDLSPSIHIVDMGSGKGYLTFALYDFLKNSLNLDVHITGIELRKELVDLCNDIAKEANFTNLTFKAQLIEEYQCEQLDILIALHACDTATDDAIFKGLSANASFIMCAPCCHKQVRKQMNCTTELQGILKHNIFEERQAEMVTDGIRSLVLEGFGYQTQAFEFISNEHTGKNVMIIGKKNSNEHKKEAFEQIQLIKRNFGIDKHYLETLIEKL
ncbi:MAG: SAM-dependent methyltransferase [Cytophagales bacterium]|nr:SAM-dependent methyltransferase [Cytophagales bacterium]